MAIDPKDFLDEDGNPRRRDNVAAELAEGDLLIGLDNELYIIKDGELVIYISGKRVGDGVPTLIPREDAGRYISQSFNLFDMNELGLNSDISLEEQ